jgi:hypothetical protein
MMNKWKWYHIACIVVIMVVCLITIIANNPLEFCQLAIENGLDFGWIVLSIIGNPVY